jgi:hypothetical protein
MAWLTTRRKVSDCRSLTVGPPHLRSEGFGFSILSAAGSFATGSSHCRFSCSLATLRVKSLARTRTVTWHAGCTVSPLDSHLEPGPLGRQAGGWEVEAVSWRLTSSHHVSEIALLGPMTLECSDSAAKWKLQGRSIPTSTRGEWREWIVERKKEARGFEKGGWV